MKTLEQLGISPAPWNVKQDSGYDRESGEFNTYDAVCDAEGKFMVEWANGESYGEVCPNSEQDATLIAAAPELYEALAAMLSCAEKEAPFTAGSGMSLAMDMARKAIKKAEGEE